MWRGAILPRWVAGLGFASGMLGWIAMWRNVTGIIAPIAALNNAVLPVWMVVFGAGLIAVGRTRARLELLAAWLDSQPDVLEGEWYKRFSGMTVCGAGGLIKTLQ